jgi:hypothetical protein
MLRRLGRLPAMGTMKYKAMLKAICLLGVSAACLFSAYSIGRVLFQGRAEESKHWPQLQSLSEQSIMALDKAITKATAEEADPLLTGDHKQWSNVQVNVIDDPINGDASDWERVARKTNKIVRSLFAQGRRGFLRVGFASPINGGYEWAVVMADTNKLPDQWQSLNHLQLFGRLDVMAGSLAVRKWECQFNAQHPEVLSEPVNQTRYCDELLHEKAAAAEAQ